MPERVQDEVMHERRVHVTFSREEVNAMFIKATRDYLWPQGDTRVQILHFTVRINVDAEGQPRGHVDVREELG